MRRAGWTHGKNRKPLKRGAWIKPAGRIKVKKRTKAEKDAKFAREYHSVAFVEWIRALPSVASGKGPCVAAHTANGGKSRKGSWRTIVPLTDAEHRQELHQHGEQTFQAKYGVDLKACASRVAALWDARENAA